MKVKYWVGGEEQSALTGVTARFGRLLPDTTAAAQKLPAVVPTPKNGCAKSSASLAGSVALAERGVCTFFEKAKTIESSGAAAMIVVNDMNGPSATACSIDY